MKSDLSRTLSLAGLFAGAFLSLLPLPAVSQSIPQITQRLDEAQTVTLKGNTPASIRTASDQGRLSPSSQANHILLVLKRSDAQEAALTKLIDGQHNPSSPSYHQWLKPGEFGKRFGVDDSDVAAVTAWLQAKGFTVNKTNSSKTTIDFSGTTGQVENAFKTEFHTYARAGVTFHSNSKDPQIPAAFAPVVKGLAALNDIKPKSFAISKGRAAFDPKTHKGTPLWNDPFCATTLQPSTDCMTYYPTPADIAEEYSLKSVYSSGVNGKGVTIGLIGDSNIDVSNVQNYRNFFHVAEPGNLPNMVIDGEDPGQNGDAEESYLDVEVSGALAPAATINMYTSADTITTPGLFTAMVRAIEDDQADILSMSYGECEQVLGTAGNQFFYYAWEQAAAQGQSVFVSTGDSGSAGCDRAQSEGQATEGIAVSGFASTPYNVAVGGTDFYYSDYSSGDGSATLNTQLAQYWGTDATKGAAASMIAPVPEQAWNDFYGLNILKIPAGYYSIASGSGGPSTCAFGVDDTATGLFDCTGGYPKPSWQRAPGMPNDGKRNIPDVSLFAADGANISAWPICVQAEDCTNYASDSGTISISGTGGTSASSPAMAGIMALIDQSQGGRQGNPNVTLYALALQYPNSFNDVTKGSNEVPCYPGTPDCSDGYLHKYTAGVGYDLATGLGSVNGANMIANWKKVKFDATTTLLGLSSSSVVHGTPVIADVAVFSAKGTPTGTAALVTSSTTPTAAGQGLVTLTNGEGTEPFYLPGGSYSVTADYSGDGIFAASESTASNITITPEPSTMVLTAIDNIPLDETYYPEPIVNGSTVQYGFPISFDVTVAGKSGQGTATGTVAYYDLSAGPGVIAQENINSYGVAEFNTAILGAGFHSIGVRYNGDPSFKATPTGGQPTTVSFYISKGTPFIFQEDESEYGSIYAGQPFSVPFLVAGSDGLAPTGKVVVTYAGQTQTVGLTQTVAEGQPMATGTAFFKNPAVAGNYTVNITYAGDNNYTAGAAYSETVAVTANTLPLTKTTLTSSTLNAADNGTFTLTATVTGSGKSSLIGGVLFYLNGTPEGAAQLVNGKASLTLTNYNLFTGKNEATAEYFADPNNAASTSAPLAIMGNEGDFTIATSNPNLNATAGHTTTATLVVTSIAGLGGSAALTCGSSTPSLTCSINPGSVTVDPYGKQHTATLTIKAAEGSASSLTHTITVRGTDAGVVHMVNFHVVIH